MPTAPRKVSRRLAWLVVAVLLGAGAFWALVPEGGDDRQAQGVGQGDQKQRDEGQGPGPNQLERFGQAMDLLRKSGPQGAAAPPTTDPLSVLFADDDAPERLGLVLTAVEANATPPEQDPLWNDLVKGIASLWNRDTLTWGLDLMLGESRPRARRAVVSSLAYLATSDRARVMTGEQRQTLTDHFIDLYQQSPRGQQPEILAAMRKMGANDAAEILLGRGLDSEDSLEINRRTKEAIRESTAAAQKAEARVTAAPPVPAQAQAEAPLPPHPGDPGQTSSN